MYDQSIIKFILPKCTLLFLNKDIIFVYSYIYMYQIIITLIKSECHRLNDKFPKKVNKRGKTDIILL